MNTQIPSQEDSTKWSNGEILKIVRFVAQRQFVTEVCALVVTRERKCVNTSLALTVHHVAIVDSSRLMPKVYVEGVMTTNGKLIKKKNYEYTNEPIISIIRMMNITKQFMAAGLVKIGNDCESRSKDGEIEIGITCVCVHADGTQITQIKSERSVNALISGEISPDAHESKLLSLSTLALAFYTPETMAVAESVESLSKPQTSPSTILSLSHEVVSTVIETSSFPTEPVIYESTLGDKGNLDCSSRNIAENACHACRFCAITHDTSPIDIATASTVELRRAAIALLHETEALSENFQEASADTFDRSYWGARLDYGMEQLTAVIAELQQRKFASRLGQAVA